jgi:hypothetical protein
MLPLNVKVGIWTGAWDSKHAICDQLDAKGLRHGLIDDRGYSTMMQSTKLATKLATKKKPPGKPGSAQKWLPGLDGDFALMLACVL